MKKRKTPFQQLMPLLSSREKNIITEVLLHLKADVAEDLCLALVAYIRFGIGRKYESPFLNVLYQSFIELINERLSDGYQSR